MGAEYGHQTKIGLFLKASFPRFAQGLQKGGFASCNTAKTVGIACVRDCETVSEK